MKVAVLTDIHFIKEKKEYFSRICSDLNNKFTNGKISLIVISGDILGGNQDELEIFFLSLRESIPDCPILIVFGNHDYWNNPRMSMFEMFQNHQELCKKYKIHYLQDVPYISSNKDEIITFFGFDGWYGQNPDQATVDSKFLPIMVESCPVHTYMANRAYKAFDNILREIENGIKGKVVLVSHFPIVGRDSEYKELIFSGSPSFFEPISENFDVFIFGHTHKEYDKVVGRCRFFNAGGSYNRIPVSIIEI